MVDDVAKADPVYAWLETVGCEGGPLLVCDVDAFAAWGGAVHSEDDELDPACDFGRALAALYPSDDDEVDAGVVRFGADDRHTGVVWDMEGAGVAEVATANDESLLIMRSWVRDNDASRRYVTGSAARAEEYQVAEWDLRSWRVAVVWAPVSADSVGVFASVAEAAAALGALKPPVRLNLDHILGVGALVRLRPGRYRVSCGSHDGPRGRYAAEKDLYGAPSTTTAGDWNCRWIRFDRLRDSGGID